MWVPGELPYSLLEVCMGMGNAGFPSLPWKSRGNGNENAQHYENGMGMGMVLLGMGMSYYNSHSHGFVIVSISCTLQSFYENVNLQFYCKLLEIKF